MGNLDAEKIAKLMCYLGEGSQVKVVKGEANKPSTITVELTVNPDEIPTDPTKAKEVAVRVLKKYGKFDEENLEFEMKPEPRSQARLTPGQRTISVPIDLKRQMNCTIAAMQILSSLRRARENPENHEKCFSDGFRMGVSWATLLLLEPDIEVNLREYLEPIHFMRSICLRAMGQENARKQWNSETLKATYQRAIEEADKRWQDGDQALHHDMAKNLCRLPEFSNLSSSQLREKLKPIAKKYGKLLGVRKKTLG